MNELRVPAPAKINLALDIRGVLPDGYHQLATIMQSLTLHDNILLKKASGRISVDSSAPDLPRGKANLAYQAAELLFQERELEVGVDIFIEKRIPVAAGLAGGSSDGAAVLKGLNILYQLGYSPGELAELGSRLGADIPFCLSGGTVLATGKGDRLEQLPDLTGIEIILVVPPVEVSTALTYQRYDQLRPRKNIPVEGLGQLLRGRGEVHWDEGWANILEEITIPLVNEIAEIKRELRERGCIFSLMSGSGPAVFGIVGKGLQAEEIRADWPRPADKVYLTRTSGKDFLELW